jgi:hypothetical protein
MNNEGGWGLRVMLVLCLIIILSLVISVTIYERNFNKLGYINTKGRKTYQLEERLRLAANKYMDDKKISRSNDYVMYSNELISEGYLTKLINETNSECVGYAEYISNNKKTNAYISCKGGYKTDGFNEEILKID